MKTYRHLSLEEREKFYAWREAGVSFREIGRRLGRSHTTFMRERVRNAKYGKPYIPCQAHEIAVKRAIKQRCKAPLKEPLIFLYVREHLRLGWSPETIAGRLFVDYPGYEINDETIYRYIYARKNRRMKLWRFLTLGRKKRRIKGGRTIHRESKIPNAVSIDLRPKSVNKRKEAGHWETDNMEGKKSDTSVVSATVERLTRLTLLTKLANRTAQKKLEALTDRLYTYPGSLRQTMTADNGAENSNHQEVTNRLGTDVYFAHAYHSWEKGTVENTIGRVRRFIPKGTSIDELTEEELVAIEYSLNNTPRKCLGFLTPNEKMSQILSVREELVKKSV